MKHCLNPCRLSVLYRVKKKKKDTAKVDYVM